MDYNLIGNRIKIKFRNAAILDGVSIHETGDQVIILLATVASIHRIVLSHPSKLIAVVSVSVYLFCQNFLTAFFQQERSRSHKNVPHEPICLNADELLTRKSIFYDVDGSTLRDPNSYYVLNATFNISYSFGSSELPYPVRSCSWLNCRREACFALANYAGDITIITMISPVEGKIIRKDLKHSSLIKTLLYNFVPSVLSRAHQESEHAALCILSHKSPFSDDEFVIALCRDLYIRIWSYQEQTCLLAQDILEAFSPSTSSQSTYSSGRNIQKPSLLSCPVLKKGNLTYQSDNLYLAVYIATPYGRKFIVYTLSDLNNKPVLFVVATVVAPEDDLLDFAFTTNTIWALWHDSVSDISLTHWELQKKSQYWQNVTLHTNYRPPNTALPPNYKNINNYFIDRIFKRGRFSMQTLSKAMRTLSQSLEPAYSQLNLEALIEEILKIIDQRIRIRLGSTDTVSDVYKKFLTEVWNEYESYCNQYHQVLNKPLSLMVDSRTGLAGILRVSSVSFIRLNDIVDHVLLSKHHPLNYIISNTLTDDPSIEASLHVLLTGVLSIDSYLTEEAKKELEGGLVSGVPVIESATLLIDNHLLSKSDVWENPASGLLTLLEKVHSEAPKLLEAIDSLLRRLNLESNYSFNEELRPELQSVELFLAGTYGNCVLTECLKQTCRLRFDFTRNLLIFQLLLLRFASKKKITIENLSDIQATSIATNALFVHCYYSMLWLSEKYMSLKSNSSLTLEGTLTLLATLELHDYININRSGSVNSLLINDFFPKSIIAYLINHQKCSFVRKFLVNRLSRMSDVSSCETWVSILPIFVELISQLIWPISKSSHIMRFLLGFEQYQLTDQYSYLLDYWCKYNIYSRQFIHGLTKLFTKKPNTSLPYFFDALSGIHSELLLKDIFLVDTPIDETCENRKSFKLTNAQLSNYFNKIIRLCRLHSLSSVIYELATEAIQYLDSSDSSYEVHYSAFLTTLFLCHLERGETNQAFQAMLLNPSHIQRKDCLRQFTARLYEKKAISEMVSYNYGDMAEDFISILEFRARSRDLLETDKKMDFYEILYSYFVKEMNFRKAASMSYEYAKRLGQEVNGIESLKKQADFLLLTINSLKLVEPNYAWIIRPVARAIPSLAMNRSASLAPGSGSKRKHSSDDDQETSTSEFSVHRELQNLGIEDIRSEYMLVYSRYRLLLKSCEFNAIAATPVSAEETVTLLIANLLFDLAFELSTCHNLPYEPILEGLVGKYVYLTELPHRKINLEAGLMEINECFVENDTAALSFIANAEMPPIDKLLFLILAYIDKYEQPNQSLLHRCVAEKLLSSGIYLPASLKLSYQAS